jgi:hypothetical protein
VGGGRVSRTPQAARARPSAPPAAAGCPATGPRALCPQVPRAAVADKGQTCEEPADAAEAEKALAASAQPQADLPPLACGERDVLRHHLQRRVCRNGSNLRKFPTSMAPTSRSGAGARAQPRAAGAGGWRRRARRLWRQSKPTAPTSRPERHKSQERKSTLLVDPLPRRLLARRAGARLHGRGVRDVVRKGKALEL